jgi:hypothetical protein
VTAYDAPEPVRFVTFALVALKSLRPTPVTGSEKVAVTWNEPLTGLAAELVRVTEGAVVSTVTVTVSVSLPPRPSSTVSSKVSAPEAGAVNVGWAVVAPVSVTAGPAVWTQL